MLAAILKKVTRQQAVVADASAALDALREQVEVAREELRRVESAPVPADEALADLAEWIDRAATDAVDRLNVGYLTAPGRAAQGLRLPFPISPGSGAVDAGPAVQILFGLFLATNRAALLEILGGQLRDLTAGRETISAAERAERVTAAKEALLQAEMAEEAACRALEASGVPVARRSDADPRAVLASDDALA